MQTIKFEQAMNELEDIVQKLEDQNIDLDKSISLYERGMYLKELCLKKINDAQLKIEKIDIKDKQQSKDKNTDKVISDTSQTSQDEPQKEVEKDDTLF